MELTIRFRHSTLWTFAGFCMVFGVGAIIITLIAESETITKSGDNGIPLGIGAIIVGILFTGYRHTIVIDKLSNRVTDFKKFFYLSIKESNYNLNNFDRVTVTKEVRRRSNKSGSSVYFVYPIRLEGGAPIPADKTRKSINEFIEEVQNLPPRSRAPYQLYLREFTAYQKARALSEKVADYLQFPLDDISSGELQHREAGELNQPLHERLREKGVQLKQPVLPPDSAISPQTTNGRTILRLPGSSSRKKIFNGVVYLLILVLFVGLPMIKSGYLELNSDYYPALAAGAVLIVLSLGIYLLLGVEVSIERSGLSVAYRLVIRWTNRTMGRDEIEQLYKTEQAVVAESDRQRITMPVPSARDRDYVFETIQYYLGGD